MYLCVCVYIYNIFKALLLLFISYIFKSLFSRRVPVFTPCLFQKSFSTVDKTTDFWWGFTDVPLWLFLRFLVESFDQFFDVLKYINNRFVDHFRFPLEKMNADHIATDTVWADWYFLCLSRSLYNLTRPVFYFLWCQIDGTKRKWQWKCEWVDYGFSLISMASLCRHNQDDSGWLI